MGIIFFWISNNENCRSSSSISFEASVFFFFLTLFSDNTVCPNQLTRTLTIPFPGPFTGGPSSPGLRDSHGIFLLWLDLDRLPSFELIMMSGFTAHSYCDLSYPLGLQLLFFDNAGCLGPICSFCFVFELFANQNLADKTGICVWSRNLNHSMMIFSMSSDICRAVSILQP